MFLGEASKRKNSQTHPHTPSLTQIHRYKDAQTRRYIHKCTITQGAHIHRRPDTLVPRDTDTPLRSYTDTKIHRCTDTKTHGYTEIQIGRCAQIH